MRTVIIMLLVWVAANAVAQVEILNLTDTGIVFRAAQTGDYAQVQIRMDLRTPSEFPWLYQTWHTWPTLGHSVVTSQTNLWSFGDYNLNGFAPPSASLFVRIVHSTQEVAFTTTAFDVIVENRGSATVSNLMVYFDAANETLALDSLAPQEAAGPFTFNSPDDWFVCPECDVVRYSYGLRYTLDGRPLERSARPTTQRSRLIIDGEVVTIEERMANKQMHGTAYRRP